MLVRSVARLSRFRADKRGNVAVIAGLVFMALIVIGGAAIDLHRAYTARTQGQDALDLAGVISERAVDFGVRRRRKHIGRPCLVDAP